jgi:hypothetical protein
MKCEDERKRQLSIEIQWLKDKLKTVKRTRHRKDLEHQIKEREYNLYLGIF